LNRKLLYTFFIGVILLKSFDLFAQSAIDSIGFIPNKELIIVLN